MRVSGSLFSETALLPLSFTLVKRKYHVLPLERPVAVALNLPSSSISPSSAVPAMVANAGSSDHSREIFALSAPKPKSASVPVTVAVSPLSSTPSTYTSAAVGASGSFAIDAVHISILATSYASAAIVSVMPLPGSPVNVQSTEPRLWWEKLPRPISHEPLVVQRLKLNNTCAEFAAPGVKRCTCIAPYPDMLLERVSFQSKPYAFAAAPSIPLAPLEYELGQNSTHPDTPVVSAAVDSMPGMLEITRMRRTTVWLYLKSGTPTSSSVRSPKASIDTHIQRTRPW